MNPALDVRDFAFWYGTTQALHDIRLSIRPRAITALIGPSGCGKSTFLRSINRLNELIPQTRYSGDILLDGKSVYAPGTDTVRLRQQVSNGAGLRHCEDERQAAGGCVADLSTDRRRHGVDRAHRRQWQVLAYFSLQRG